jgi:hypothetical protein
MGLAFRVPALDIETNVLIYIVEEPCIEPGALLALRASSGLGREIRVVRRERSVREVKIQILFNPCRERTGWKQVRFFVLPVLSPTMLIGLGLARLRQPRD